MWVVGCTFPSLMPAFFSGEDLLLHLCCLIPQGTACIYSNSSITLVASGLGVEGGGHGCFSMFLLFHFGEWRMTVLLQ